MIDKNLTTGFGRRPFEAYNDLFGFGIGWAQPAERRLRDQYTMEFYRIRWEARQSGESSSLREGNGHADLETRSAPWCLGIAHQAADHVVLRTDAPPAKSTFTGARNYTVLVGRALPIAREK